MEFDPVERDLNEYLKKIDEDDKYQEALNDEFEDVKQEFFTPGNEHEGALQEAVYDYMDDNDKGGQLAKHILNADYGPARNIVEDAIDDWCEVTAEMRLEAKKRDREEEKGRTNVAKWPGVDYDDY